MKIPGMGEVKNKNLLIGGGVVFGVVGYAYWKKKRQVPAPTGDGTVDPNAIDPTTGIPYGQESGSAGFYTGSSMPNPYVTQGSTATTGTNQVYTSNISWESDALQNAQSFFGVSYATASSAFGKYFRQDPKGLSPDEYAAVSEVVGLMGQPPVGGPYRLIQAAPSSNPSSTPTPEPEPTPEPSQRPSPVPSPPVSPTPPTQVGHMQDAQWATLLHGTSLRTYARWNYPVDMQTHLNTLIQLNPGLNPDDTTHANMYIKTSNPHMVYP